MLYSVGALLILAVFYLICFGKMLLQKRQGIQTDQMARGKDRPHDREFYTELVLKAATWSVAAAELFCILSGAGCLPGWARGIGLALGAAGDAVFALAVYTMRDSWRAGLARQDKTDLVTHGIYRISRNPAFLGFDLMYLGILLLFCSPLLTAFTLFAIGMLHLQILQEEAYLAQVFGDRYLAYKKQVCRYLGRKAK